MNIIVGFGKVEEEYRQKVKLDVKKIVKQCINKKFNLGDDVLFHDEILADIKDKVEKYALATREAKEEISKKDIGKRPERYSSVYITVLGDVIDLFFGIEYIHFNSKHPLSPDGMAMMSTTEAIWINSLDYKF